jgi:hypothetical protein
MTRTEIKWLIIGTIALGVGLIWLGNMLGRVC